MGKRKSPVTFRSQDFGPSVEIRTQGLLNPIQARYQTSPHPDTINETINETILVSDSLYTIAQMKIKSKSFLLKFWKDSCSGIEKEDYSKSRKILLKRKSPVTFRLQDFGPSVEIRTQGLLNPIQARYQTSPHPDTIDGTTIVPDSLDIIPWRKEKSKLFFEKILIFLCFLRGERN